VLGLRPLCESAPQPAADGALGMVVGHQDLRDHDLRVVGDDLGEQFAPDLRGARQCAGAPARVRHTEISASVILAQVLADPVGVAGERVGSPVARADRPAVRRERGDSRWLELVGELLDRTVPRDLEVERVQQDEGCERRLITVPFRIDRHTPRGQLGRCGFDDAVKERGVVPGRLALIVAQKPGCGTAGVERVRLLASVRIDRAYAADPPAEPCHLDLCGHMGSQRLH
jgi:hypothetical protein